MYNGKCVDKLMLFVGVLEVYSFFCVRFNDVLNLCDKCMYLCLLWVFLIVFEMLFKLCFEGVYIDYDDIFWISNNIVKY